MRGTSKSNLSAAALARRDRRQSIGIVVRKDVDPNRRTPGGFLVPS